MNLEEIKRLLKAETLTENPDFRTDDQKVMATDLMSDVLAYCCSDALLITGLINSQAVRTADVADLCAIVFARGKRPSEETIQLAEKHKIPLFVTQLPVYEACGILYARGIKGI